MSLSIHDIKRAAEDLGVEPCAVKAVIDVESSGSGFLPDGRPKILFEGHVFWRELKKRGINPETLKMPGVLHEKRTAAHYRRGSEEWERLDDAARVNKEAALCSASWGAFQIMGFNFRACGFTALQDFVAAMHQSEAEHLAAFCGFMRSEGLILFLTGRDWPGFARRYNGPGYAAHQYDIKLQRAYERCRAGGQFA